MRVTQLSVWATKCVASSSVPQMSLIATTRLSFCQDQPPSGGCCSRTLSDYGEASAPVAPRSKDRATTGRSHPLRRADALGPWRREWCGLQQRSSGSVHAKCSVALSARWSGGRPARLPSHWRATLRWAQVLAPGRCMPPPRRRAEDMRRASSSSDDGASRAVPNTRRVRPVAERARVPSSQPRMSPSGTTRHAVSRR